MKKIVLVFICTFIACLSATPNLQKSDLAGILVRCAKKNLSYIHAIDLLHNGTIKKIRTEAPNAVLLTYIKTSSSSAELTASEEVSHTTAARSDSPDSSMTFSTESHITDNPEIFPQETALLPEFLRKNLEDRTKKNQERIITYFPQTAIAKLTAFLFPMHNGQFRANDFTSCFLGTPYGPALIKAIVNILTSATLTHTNQTEQIETQKKIIVDKIKSTSKADRKGLKIDKAQADIDEFLKTLIDLIDESPDKDLPIQILMSYLWEKSETYDEAIDGLNIYSSTATAAHTEAHRQEELRIIDELKDSDPAKIFPTLMDKVVLNTGKPHGDCAEVTVRNFLNLAILNPNGSVKGEFHELVRTSALLSQLYSLTDHSSNLINDEQKAQTWNNLLISIGVNCTESNPSTEMKAGFKNFINVLNFLLKLSPIPASNLCTQFQAICQKLSMGQTIMWRRKSEASGQWRTTDISNYDEIIFGIEKDGKSPKTFTLHQGCGHAFIA